MCMRDCDRREDSDDRQMCRSRCFDSMSGHYQGSFNMEHGWGNYEMCMRDCEESDDRQMCRNRCSDSMSGSYDSYRGSFNMEYGWGNYEMCMRDCDRRESSNDRQMCRNRCFSMSGRYHGSFNMEHGWGNYEMCMRDCDRREDSDDRQMCRNRCFNSMSGSYPGSFNNEETIARTYGSGNFQMSRCMDDCDRREDSEDRQMCRNRCFNSMSGRHPGSFNNEEAIASSYGSGNFQMSRCMDDCDRR